jgi:DNA-binding transcriptional ArsR family regulator
VNSLNSSHDEILKAIKHPVKRRIIEHLRDADLSFTELLNTVGESNHGKFGYHLRKLETFVELEPSTKKYRLTDRGRLLAGLIRDFSVIASKNRRFTKYAQSLRLGDHAFVLYDTEHFRRKIVFPFLEAGLSRGEAVVYLVSEHKLDSERREIKRYRINVDDFRTEAFTIMSAEEWYLKRGKTKAETIIANWLTLAKEKQKATRARAAFTGLRGAGDTRVFFENEKINELLRYEKALGRQLPHNICGLCLYDANKLDRRQFIQVYNSHGHIISKDIIGKTVV